jgi:hypothetical protein
MAAKEARRYRNMLLTMMGQIIIDQYGEDGFDHLMNWRYDQKKQEWADIAKSTSRSDPEYLFCLFTDEVHEFEVIRKSKTALEVKVTKCTHADYYKEANAAHIGEKVICNGDFAVSEGFNPKIKFTRPTVLMAGDDCCHFIWELPEE